MSIYPIDSVFWESPIIGPYSFSLVGTLRTPSEEAWAILRERPEREREAQALHPLHSNIMQREAQTFLPSWPQPQTFE